MNKKLFACLWDGEDLPGYSAGRYSLQDAIKLSRSFGPDVEMHLIASDNHGAIPVSMNPFLWGAQQGCGPLDLHRFHGYADSLPKPGWAPMLEVFRPDLWPMGDERHVMVGLDTVCMTHENDWLWEWDIRDVGLIHDPYKSGICNGVMSWNRRGAEVIWETYMEALQENGMQQFLYGSHPSEMVLLR